MTSFFSTHLIKDAIVCRVGDAHKVGCGAIRELCLHLLP